MKKNLIPVLLICLTVLTSCGSDVCTVVMEEVCAAADPVTMTIAMADSTEAGLTFTINGIPYTVSGSPVVSAPAYDLTTTADDGMQSVKLWMDLDDPAQCAGLYMMPAEGAERVYICPLSELEPFMVWIRSNA
ncbi:MAG: hypothetical protein IJ480_01120 [Clostridia bacterium]|nr:hypothetical protein [Clostridia bacterium]